MFVLAKAILYFILFLLFGYSILRFFHLWKRTRLPKALFFVCQIIILGFLFVCMFYSRLITSQRIKEILWMIAGMIFAAYIYLPIFCLIREIIRVLIKNKKKHDAFYHFINHPSKSIYLFLVISMVMGVLSYGNMRWIRTTTYTVDAAGKKEVTIVFVSDCHMGSGTTKRGLEKIVQTVNEMKPDILLFGGDIVDENTPKEFLEEIKVQFQKMKSVYGKFAVEGESDLEKSDTYAKIMEDAGVMMLKDQTTFLYNGISITGLRDQSDKKKIAAGSYLKQLKERGEYSIVVSHRPRKLDDMAKENVSLVLCGHTKGGQYPVKNLTDRMGNTMVYGQKKIGTTTAITTSGTGGYGIPTKVIAPSEIVHVRVVSK